MGGTLPFMADSNPLLLLFIGVVGLALFKPVNAAICFFLDRATLTLQLRGYQIEFLDRLAEYEGSHSEALRGLCEMAMSEPGVKRAMFDRLHCVHRGSDVATWIWESGCTKAPTECTLPAAVCGLLKSPLILPTERKGSIEQVVAGPRRADASKAARCAIDWAIGHYGARTDEGNEAFVQKCDDHVPLEPYHQTRARVRRAALHVLMDRGVNEEGLRKRIVAMADL